MLRPLLALAFYQVMSTCKTCGATATSPTPGCLACALPVVPEAAAHSARTEAARDLYPNYDVEGLPDARHDEAGAIYNTGKVRALRSHDSGSIPTGAHRPPVLASEALREDLHPQEPGVVIARWVGAACGVASVMLGVWTLGASVTGITILALGTAQVCAALLPLSYALRATVQVALATALLAGSTVAKVVSNADTQPGLVLPIVVLATGLLFRSWHRDSRQARWVVACGVALAAGWLGWSDGVNAALSANPQWQSWLPAVTRLALAPVLLAALLAFMGETTTGGCAAWAGSALVWYGAVSVIETLAAIWPIDSAVPTLDALQHGITAARLLSALAAPVLAVGIAQLMVVAASEPSADGVVQRPT